MVLVKPKVFAVEPQCPRGGGRDILQAREGNLGGEVEITPFRIPETAVQIRRLGPGILNQSRDVRLVNFAVPQEKQHLVCSRPGNCQLRDSVAVQVRLFLGPHGLEQPGGDAVLREGKIVVDLGIALADLAVVREDPAAVVVKIIEQVNKRLRRPAVVVLREGKETVPLRPRACHGGVQTALCGAVDFHPERVP